MRWPGSARTLRATTHQEDTLMSSTDPSRPDSGTLELDAVGQRIAARATRTRGNSLRLDLRLYVGNDGQAWLKVHTPGTPDDGIVGRDDAHLVEQFRALLAAVRAEAGR